MRNRNNKYFESKERLVPNLVLAVMSLFFVIPLLYVISISLSSEMDIMEYGYRIFPKVIDVTAYRLVFRNPEQIIYAYATTAFVSVVGTFCSLIVLIITAYPLSRNNFKFKNPITFFMFFTMLFNGGLIPSYIINTKYLGLRDNILVYILPSLVNVWYIIIIRTFFSQLPASLIESAKIDGANEFNILFKIIIPLSKPVIATISMFTILAKWNDWNTSLIYIENTKLYTLQYLLQRLLREIQFLRSVTTNMPPGISANFDYGSLPAETLKFAMCIVASGPMLIVFPFFQKYFVKGLTIGSIKG